MTVHLTSCGLIYSSLNVSLYIAFRSGPGTIIIIIDDELAEYYVSKISYSASAIHRLEMRTDLTLDIELLVWNVRREKGRGALARTFAHAPDTFALIKLNSFRRREAAEDVHAKLLEERVGSRCLPSNPANLTSLIN